MAEYKVDLEEIVRFLVDLLNTPSPTGDCEKAIACCEAALKGLPVSITQTEKGALVATWKGKNQDRPRAVTAHVDTLGAMVKEIKSSGRLKLTNLGGLNWNSVECEGVSIETEAGDLVRGSIMPVKASSHVHGDDAKNEKRNADTLEVRLDAMVSSAEDVEALGVQVGDFVYVDPRVELTDGFIRSRFLDDKACVACMVGAMQALHQAGLAPAQRTTFHFSTYEEVGHGGAAGFPPDIVELLTLDMAAIGEGQSSDEFHTTICVKDSGGPYHLGFRRRLIGLAKKHEIPYKLDIYTYYASDGEALWHAGADVEVGLLGPGIDGSHSYERTHEDSLKSTTELLVAYLLSE